MLANRHVSVVYGCYLIIIVFVFQFMFILNPTSLSSPICVRFPPLPPDYDFHFRIYDMMQKVHLYCYKLLAKYRPHDERHNQRLVLF